MKQSSSLKIDIFPHILPLKYKDMLYKKAKTCYHIEANLRNPALFDLNIRFRAMDKYEGLVEVLTLSAPPVEFVVSPEDAVGLSKVANDEMAELVLKYPDRFVAAVACLPMNNVAAALRETERVIKDLNFKGVQIASSINGKPLDRPEFRELYEKMMEYDLPLWIHPTKDQKIADYRGERGSKYRIFSHFGWPYETTLAMARLVYSGILEKYPNIKFITHHCGGMIPYFKQRTALGPTAIKTKYAMELTKPPLDYFCKFYADTALSGNVAGLMCGYAFFGADNILFGTDYPHAGGAERNEYTLGEAINSINSMNISQNEKEKIFSENAKRLLHLPGQRGK